MVQLSFSLLSGNTFCYALFTTVLVCLDYVSLLVMWTPRNLKPPNLLYYSPVDEIGGVLSPLLYSLFTHDCTARHDSNTIIKFANDTTVLGLITDNDDTGRRSETWPCGARTTTSLST